MYHHLKKNIMNAITEQFIKESGITRFDRHWLQTEDGIIIPLQEDEDCTPAELVHKIIQVGKERFRVNLNAMIGNPVQP